MNTIENTSSGDVAGMMSLVGTEDDHVTRRKNKKLIDKIRGKIKEIKKLKYK